MILHLRTEAESHVLTAAPASKFLVGGPQHENLRRICLLLCTIILWRELC